MSVSLSFPDQNYSTSNKPSVETLKTDLSLIEADLNALDAAAVTETGSQTLTNKTLTSPVLNTSVSGTAVLDEDTMASNSATKLATQQSIKAYVDTSISTAVAAAKSALFPIGSMYFSIVSTNPATLLGFGTWSQVAGGKFIVGQTGSDTDFDTAEETGGAKTHTHTYSGTTSTDSGGGKGFQDSGSPDGAVLGHTHTYSGTSDAGSTIPPYYTAYVWKRTA